MKYKIKDSVKLLKGYASNYSSKFFDEGSYGKVYKIDEDGVLIDFSNSSSNPTKFPYLIKVKEEDLYFLERVTEDRGTCPNCGVVGNLNYETIIDSGSGETMYYPFVCDSCGARGEEYYVVEFLRTVMTEVEE